MFSLLSLAAQTTLAGSGVTFDVSPLVACQEISSTEFVNQHPYERLFEAQLNASLWINGPADQVVECQFQFHAPERRIRVDDYLPRTTMSSDVVGNIDVQRSADDSKNLQLSVGGRFQSAVSGDFNAGGHQNQSASYRFEQLPPKQTLSASGTVARGSGVYYKLRPTSQTTLEGSHSFVIRFRANDRWRADYLRAVCVARSRDGRICGRASFLVPIFKHGDFDARRMARELVDYEQQLVDTATRYQRTVRKISLPTIAHELSLLPRELPENWLSLVVHSPARQRQPFETSLPQPVRSAIDTYRDAKLALSRNDDNGAIVETARPQLPQATLLGISQAASDEQDGAPTQWVPRG